MSARAWTLALCLLPVAAGCSRDFDVGGDREGDVRGPAAIAGGDPGRGRDAIRRSGCGSCHDIPGVTGAHGAVGPPLGGIAGRVYIAGVLPNTPDNMVQWLLDPPRVDSLTAMPKTGLRDAEARDVAAYLYGLR